MKIVIETNEQKEITVSFEGAPSNQELLRSVAITYLSINRRLGLPLDRALELMRRYAKSFDAGLLIVTDDDSTRENIVEDYKNALRGRRKCETFDPVVGDDVPTSLQGNYVTAYEFQQLHKENLKLKRDLEDVLERIQRIKAIQKQAKDEGGSKRENGNE